VEAFVAHKYLTTWQIGWLVEVIFVSANVFTGVQSFSYWSATTFTASPTSAWLVDFADGNVGWGGKTDTQQVWCVRGPMNADAY